MILPRKCPLLVMGKGSIEVAIVGMSAVFPKASSLEMYWENIVNGVDGISEVPAQRWDPVYFDPEHAGVDRFYCKNGGFIDGLKVLDPISLGIIPASIDSAEPDQLLCMALATSALNDCGYEVLENSRDRTGIIVGRGGYLTPGLARLDQRVRTCEQLMVALETLIPDLDEDQVKGIKEEFLSQLGPDRPFDAIDLVPNLAASRVANRLDLGGPAYTVDAACASSLIALDAAVRELASNRCDVMLVGGVHLCHDVTLWSVFTQLGALSRTGTIRPFDRRADGLLIGEGGGMLALQRLDDAQRLGSRIYAVVKGIGISSDGRSGSLMRPGGDGQLLSLRRGWTEAALNPSRIGLIEAHGTGTPAGDSTELDTLRRFFTDDIEADSVSFGSVKSMIGHTMPAAGIAGLIKATLAVYEGVCPGSLHCEEPLDSLELTKFNVSPTSSPWESASGRVGAVNAFGFGGINAHVVIEEHQGNLSDRNNPSAFNFRIPNLSESTTSDTSDSSDTSGSGASIEAKSFVSLSKTLLAAGQQRALDHVLLIRARTVEDLLISLDRIIDQDILDDSSTLLSTDGIYGEVGSGTSLDFGNPLYKVRLALFDPSRQRLELSKKIAERAKPWRGRRDIWFTPEGLSNQGAKLAFVFPGVEPTFEPRISDVAEHFHLPIPELVGNDAVACDLEGLGRSLISVGRLIHKVLKELGFTPDVVAGQSIGEWSGMIATEMIPSESIDGFIDTLRPGSLEVPGVEFIAIGSDLDTAISLIGKNEELAISHDNCPHQTIVCGPTSDIADLAQRCRSKGVMCQVLPFRSGFHTPMFSPFLAPFREALARLPLQEPKVELWSATTCASYPLEPNEVRELALSHLIKRVRFRELVLKLYDAGVRIFVQVGVGSLPGLIEDTLSEGDILAIASNTARRSGMVQLLRTASACWVEGVSGIQFDKFTVQKPEQMRSKIAMRSLSVSSSMVRFTPLDLNRGSEVSRHGTLDRVGPSLHGGQNGLIAMEIEDLLDEVAITSQMIAQALSKAPTQSFEKTASDHFESESNSQSGQSSSQLLSARSESSLGISKSDIYPIGYTRTINLVLSLESYPELQDHCFYRQPLDWPIVDRFPVVPMTALMSLMMQAANTLLPDMVPTAISDIRALRWLAVEPGADVTVRVVMDEPDQFGYRVKVSIEGYARATVTLNRSYPMARFDHEMIADCSPLPITAREMYDDRWMFHGPQYQGVRELVGMGVNGIRGTIEVTRGIGALLDNAGQLMGLWAMLTFDRDRLALPTSIGSVHFYGHDLEPGESVSAEVKITSTDEAAVTAQMELYANGKPWAKIQDWTDRRFESDEQVWSLLIWPELSGLSEHFDDGFSLAYEHWRSSASRELMMRRYLNEAERRLYDAHNPRAQRLFLLGRIAAKDAARHWLWEHGAGPIWPAEISIFNNENGQPTMTVPGDEQLIVSIAHTPWLGVASVGRCLAIGIDAERIEPRSDRFVETAFRPEELDHLMNTNQERDEWITRGWAAKEAVGKAQGKGLLGRPKDFVISDVRGDVISIGNFRVKTRVRDSVAIAYTRLDE